MHMIDNKLNTLALILDGNRRLAKRMMLEPWKGHELGTRKVKDVLTWCKDLNIKNIILYAFSTENFNRPKTEFDYIMKLFEKEFSQIVEDPKNEVHKYGIRVRIIGRKDMLPKHIKELAEKAEKITENYKNYNLYVAIAYGGRYELIDAFNKIAVNIRTGKVKEITPEIIKDNLYTTDMPDPDLIIRTGGERRLSNFLTWQSVYSELFFTDTYWPDLTKEEFLKIINDFETRQRRFGK